MYEGEVVLHASPYNYVLSKLDSIYNTLSCGLYDKICLNGVTDHRNSLVLTQSRIITVKAVCHIAHTSIISTTRHTDQDCAAVVLLFTISIGALCRRNTCHCCSALCCHKLELVC
jgi:hypothetical protein